MTVPLVKVDGGPNSKAFRGGRGRFDLGKLFDKPFPAQFASMFLSELAEGVQNASGPKGP